MNPPEGQPIEPREVDNIPRILTSQEFAERYDGKTIWEAVQDISPLDEKDDYQVPEVYFDNLADLLTPYIPLKELVINEKFFEPGLLHLKERIKNRFIPLRPAEGEAGKKTRELFNQKMKESKSGFVFAVVVRAPGGRREQEAHINEAHKWATWGSWRWGFIDVFDLGKSPKELLATLKGLIADLDDPERRQSFTNLREREKFKKNTWHRISMVELALFAQTPEEELINLPSWDDLYLIDHSPERQSTAVASPAPAST